MRSSIAATLLFSACSYQVGDDYRGEVVGRVQGTLVGEIDRAQGGAEVALLWNGEAEVPEEHERYRVGESADVTGEFPARFQLELRQPPPDGEAIDWASLTGADPAHEAGIAVAWVVATAPGSVDGGGTAIEDESWLARNVLGGAEDHLILYLDRDVEPGSFSERMLHGPLAEGYHLMRIERQDTAAWHACMEEWMDGPGEGDLLEACGCYPHEQAFEVAMDTPIAIRLAPVPDDVDDSDLLLPEWDPVSLWDDRDCALGP